MRTTRLFYPGLLGVLSFLASGCATYEPKHEKAEPKAVKPALSMSATRTMTTQPREADKAPAAPRPASPSVSTTNDAPVQYAYRLQMGDPVVVHLRGIYPRDEEVEDIVDDAGNITLPHLGDTPAAGKSTSEIESEVRRMYIDGGYYNSITVNVVMPQRTYFIRGEVKGPGRFPVVGGMTLTQAIATAGGYTEFANPKKVNMIRGGRTRTFNMREIERNPETDIRLESGDVIVVERSIF